MMLVLWPSVPDFTCTRYQRSGAVVIRGAVVVCGWLAQQLIDDAATAAPLVNVYTLGSAAAPSSNRRRVTRFASSRGLLPAVVSGTSSLFPVTSDMPSPPCSGFSHII